MSPGNRSGSKKQSARRSMLRDGLDDPRGLRAASPKPKKAVDLWTIRLRRTGALAVDNDKAVIHRAPLCPQAPQPVIILKKSPKTSKPKHTRGTQNNGMVAPS